MSAVHHSSTVHSRLPTYPLPAGHERAVGLEGVYRLLTNVVYVGKIRYQKELHDAEHPAILEPAVWQQVQELLQQHGPGRAKGPPSHCGALLRC
jgi:hypothetical protein